MVRVLIIGIVIAVAFTLYAVVDAAMTDGSRARGVSKPVWVVLVVVLPVIGAILWFIIGKGSTPPPQPKAPDDDPRFTGTQMSADDLDDHMRDLEDRLRELDEETFPGEKNSATEGTPERAAEPPIKPPIKPTAEPMDESPSHSESKPDPKSDSKPSASQPKPDQHPDPKPGTEPDAASKNRSSKTDAEPTTDSDTGAKP